MRTVGTKAFAYDQKLKYVQLTDGLQQIGASAFTGCTALKVLELPDTVTTLGDHVFENCTALASVLLSRWTDGAAHLRISELYCPDRRGGAGQRSCL